MEALTTNGTDEGILRAWLDREVRHWRRALEASLRREIGELRREYLGERPHHLAASPAGTPGFASALVDLLSFARSSGALNDDGLRRLRETAEPIAGAGTAAFDEALNRARQAPTGAQALHESWARCLMLLLYRRAADGQPYPGPDALDRERLAWARTTLNGLDDAGSLQAALEDYLADPGVRPVVAAVVEHGASEVLRYQKTLPANRIRLIVDAATRWLAGAVERT